MSQNEKAKKYRFHYYIIALLCCCIVFSCAQITAPTGGERDKTPPKVLKSTPENYSINFHQRDIKVVFDEWIQPLANPKNQVIISPNVEPFPKIEIARNELTIKLKDSLQPNTTYSIFFGDNLKDNNEGNAQRDYKYIFSTGSFIDSLQVKGVITTSLGSIPENTYLLLYKEKEDSAFTKKRPFYITKIGTDGSFSLENVKEGDYKIYALSDKNGNYYYDLPTEAIGFVDSLSHVTSNVDKLSLELFMPEEEKLRIIDFDRVIKGGILHLTFNKELSLNKDDITVSILDNKTINPIAFQEKTAKTMSIYFPKMSTDTNSFTLILKNNNDLIDSLKVRTESRNFKKPILFFNDTTAYKALNIIETTPLKLISSYYSLSDIDTSRIFITDTSKAAIAYKITRDEDLQTYSVVSAWKAGMQYKIRFLDSAFTDLVGNYNKKQEISFSVLSTKKAGNLLITYKLPKENQNYIAFLKDNSGKVLDKRILRDSQTVKIDYGWQFAGSYTVEVIDDVNKNGIWNSGNFSNKTLPEKIYKEPKPILIKENWDAEEVIQVDFSIQAKILPLNETTPQKTNNILNNTQEQQQYKNPSDNSINRKE